MIVWSLALVLTLGMVAVVYLPYRSAKTMTPTVLVGAPWDTRAVEANVEHVLRLWYCAMCGGRLERLDQKVCSHCGTVVGDGGGS